MSEPFRYISYGAGVQSTALLVMSALGMHGVPKADIAVFADTGDEPDWVYETLRYYTPFATERGIPIVIGSKGIKLSEGLNAGANGNRYATIPAYVDLGGQQSITRRQCTGDFKIDVIARAVRHCGPFCGASDVSSGVVSLQGISLDEVYRMKPNKRQWITNQYPLIEARLTRDDCKKFLHGLGLPVPKKSSCVFCPFHGDAYWLDLKRNHVDEFNKAVRVDLVIRDMSKRGMKNPLYLHRSLVPLSEVKFRHEDQREMFGNECEGVCGV